MGGAAPGFFEGLEALSTLDSRVTVLFRDLGTATEISITHERLETDELRDFHRWGWNTTLDQLERIV